MNKLLVATHNLGKIREYRMLLADLPLVVTWLEQEGVTLVVEETGDTFVANASLKAQAYAAQTGLWTWADDSGLVVDALDGRPGVQSARYGGPELSDVERYQHLLGELRTVPPEQRSARFCCVVALALPAGPVYTAEGMVEGIIVDTPDGEYGFGYDPIFYLPDYHATMAALQPAVKNRISHRAVAVANARKILVQLLANLPQDQP